MNSTLDSSESRLFRDSAANGPLRVLHSFPHRLGMSRICTIAWHEIDSVAEAGARLTVFAGDSIRPFSREVLVKKTLSRGILRFPYRLLGPRRSCMLHDWIVASRINRMAKEIDIVHTWPLGALQTIRAAKRLGIPVALERCNAHTRFAYEVVERECRRIGVELPKSHEHAYNANTLELEEKEYAGADGLLCPSDFTAQSFRDLGFAEKKLVRFIYGVDETKFFPEVREPNNANGLTMIFVGVCAVRKGLHFALDAWLNSTASKTGRFVIAGGFIEAYKKKLTSQLSHPSVEVLGHRNDIPALMRRSDVFVLPSIEEGFGLVCTEAMASGCVPLVSNACTDLCQHTVNSLVHNVADTKALTEHLNQLDANRPLLHRLRVAGIENRQNVTWSAAGRSLLKAYQKVIANSCLAN
jgi:glycosyltransferase involved in cell wall biosynthesis